LEADEHALDSKRLAIIDGPGVQALLRRPNPLPFQDERARLLREVHCTSAAARLTMAMLQPENWAPGSGSGARVGFAAAAPVRYPPQFLPYCLPPASAELQAPPLRTQPLQQPFKLVCTAFTLPQVGRGLLDGFGGHAAHMVHAAGRSAARLVTLMTAALPGFRDHCIYRRACRGGGHA
jgi:hypothetical protein